MNTKLNNDNSELESFRNRYEPYISYLFLIVFLIPILIIFFYIMGNENDETLLFISILMAAIWVRALVTLFIYNLPNKKKL